ncbi:MAG: hypothetical protein GX236_11600 [Clostridiaceae bacterium]|jgi:hypothetical protein|nr:hypothetical protein [Clostridiaceae bacterium]
MSAEKIQLLLQGLEVTGFGLLGVFGALVAFYAIVILLGKIPEKKTESEN